MISVVPPVALHQAARRDAVGGCLPRPAGLRALSKRHATEPFRLDLGGLIADVDYEPGKSTSGLFGGNSNWRGPVWFPINYLTSPVAPRTGTPWLGPDNTVEYPTGSGQSDAPAARGRRPGPPARLDLAARRRGSPALSTARSRSSRPTRNGTTCCSSTSTSTATPARASAPRTRPAGPAWSRT